MQKGRLYLLPMTLGETETDTVIPQGTAKIISELNVFIVENIRTTRRYIRKLHPDKDIDSIRFFELNKHTPPESVNEFLQEAENGKDTGLISEAGNPGIADPGASVTALAHKKNIKVVPLTGPSSILMALISSGMNGQNFAFNGYLPINPNDRTKKLKQLELRSAKEKQSQIFMETPFRNNKLLDVILTALQKNTRLCIAADITLDTEYIKTQSIAQWKKNKPDLHKRPAIFIIQAD